MNAALGFRSPLRRLVGPLPRLLAAQTLLTVALAAILFLPNGSATALAPTIDLATTAPDFKVVGAEADDAIGRRLAVGDFDGDGVDDLLLGSARGDGPGNLRTDAGEAHVIFGYPALWGTRDLATTADLIIYGADPGDFLGMSVAAADVDGDLLDDIIVGAPEADGPGNVRTNGGEAYVFFGSATLSGSRDICQSSCAGGSQGAGPDLTIFGAEAFDELGRKVGAGLVDGDSYADIVAAAPVADGPGAGTTCGIGQTGDRCSGGEAYVFVGSATLSGSRDICQSSCSGGSQGAGPNLTVFGGEGGDGLGSHLAIGDITGDGRADIAVGADDAFGPTNARHLAGEAYVVFGSATVSGSRDVCQPADVCGGGSQGPAPDLTVYGAERGDGLGSRLAIGQVNGTGPSDLIVSAKFADGPGVGTCSVGQTGDRCFAGEAYVVFGSVALSGPIDMCQPPAVCGGGSQGAGPNVTIYAAEAVDEMSSLASGDVDGDGVGDILVASDDADGPANGRLDAGEAYVIYGSGSLSTPIDIALSQQDVTIYGAEAGDDLGAGLASGDLNGDGAADLIVGAPDADGPGSGVCLMGTGDRCTAGEVYVFLSSGGTATPTPTPTPPSTPTPTPTPLPTSTPTPTPTPTPTSNDADSDGVPDDVDNCPAVPNEDQQNTDLELGGAGATISGVPIGDGLGDACDGDDDDDGYTDVAEAIIGTAPDDNCTNTSGPGPGPNTDAWPSDMNLSDSVNLTDISGPFKPHFGTVEGVDPTGTGPGEYNPRVDLNLSGSINLTDISGPYKPDFGESCT